MTSDEVFSMTYEKLKNNQVDITKFVAALYQFYPKAIYDPSQFRPGDFDSRKKHIPAEIEQINKYIEIIKPKMDDAHKILYLKFLSDYYDYVPEEFKPQVQVILNNYFPKSNSPCYIATMCYGNAEATKVDDFRSFRDKYLTASYLGIKFIKVYYNYSPKIVTFMRNKVILISISKALLEFLRLIIVPLNKIR